jgi:hypothetical protein
MGTNHTSLASQADRILQVLQDRGSAWTPAPELARISLQYCHALHSLRKSGISIENHVVVRDCVKFGFYRLKQEQKGPAPVQMSQQEPPRTALASSLFGDLAPESRYPD